MKKQVVILLAILLLTLCACSREPVQPSAVQESPAQAETAENSVPEEPTAEKTTLGETEPEEIAQDAPEQAEWRVDVDALTDAYLLDIILGAEIALTRDNSFTFSDPKELSSQELYMMFLYLGSYDTFARDCLNEESGEFLFTKDYISDELSQYFKDFSLDITQTTGYDAERDVVVSMNPSGFGGDRFVNIVEKQIDGNYVTLTLDFYDNYERTGEPYQRKTYRLEFYDGGYYYLSAVVD